MLKPALPNDAPFQSTGKPDKQAGVDEKGDKFKWVYERKGVDKLIADGTDPKKPDEKNQEKFGKVLQLSGFADWRLTEFRLPALHK